MCWRSGRISGTDDDLCQNSMGVRVIRPGAGHWALELVQAKMLTK